MKATSMLRLLFDLALYFLLGGLLLAAGIAAYLVPNIPDTAHIEDVRLQVPLRVYTDDGQLLGEFGSERRDPVDLEALPELYLKAVLAAEDDRFFRHPGVDLKGLARAAANALTTGRITQGGSTITMQLARNLFLTPEKTLKRKFMEIVLALKIEKEFNKLRIMELYVNKIFFGNRAYGITAAAQVYYGKAPTELNIAQMAMLAGIPQLPSLNNPVRNPLQAVKRRDYVLDRMLTLGYITPKQHHEAITFDDNAGLHRGTGEVSGAYVAEMVRLEMLKRYGKRALSEGFSVYTTVRELHQQAAVQALQQNLLDYSLRHGYRGPERRISLSPESGADEWEKLLAAEPVYGGLYPALVLAVSQQSAEVYLSGIGKLTLPWQALAWARPHVSQDRQGPQPIVADEVLTPGDLVRIRENAQGGWQLAQLPAAQGCLLALNPVDGAILALTGGFDYRLSSFNRATQAWRQPGSGFKPFIYAAALEAGSTAASLLNDAPTVYPGLGSNGGDWRPKNYSGKYYGPTRMREALVYSRNLASVKLLEATGVKFTRQYLRRFGFDIERLSDNLSMALGSGEVTPLQLARAYAVFANGGYLIKPYIIRKIENRDGRILYHAQPKPACTQGKCPVPPATASTAAVGFHIEDDRHESSMAPLTITPQIAWLISSFTRDAILHGTGRRARVLGRGDLSGKTGTTNDQRDAWFSGYNYELVAISWTGFDDFSPLGRLETGANAALPAWIAFMEKALRDVPESVMSRPPGLINVDIEPGSGRPVTDDTHGAIISEVFRSQFAPQPVLEPLTTPPGGTDDIRKQLF